MSCIVHEYRNNLYLIKTLNECVQVVNKLSDMHDILDMTERPVPVQLLNQ